MCVAGTASCPCVWRLPAGSHPCVWRLPAGSRPTVKLRSGRAAGRGQLPRNCHSDPHKSSPTDTSATFDCCLCAREPRLETLTPSPHLRARQIRRKDPRCMSIRLLPMLLSLSGRSAVHGGARQIKMQSACGVARARGSQRTCAPRCSSTQAASSAEVKGGGSGAKAGVISSKEQQLAKPEQQFKFCRHAPTKARPPCQGCSAVPGLHSTYQRLCAHAAPAGWRARRAPGSVYSHTVISPAPPPPLARACWLQDVRQPRGAQGARGGPHVAPRVQQPRLRLHRLSKPQDGRGLHRRAPPGWADHAVPQVSARAPTAQRRPPACCRMIERLLGVRV